MATANADIDHDRSDDGRMLADEPDSVTEPENHDDRCECAGNPEKLPKYQKVTWRDFMLILVFGICAYLFDVSSDIDTAVYHLNNGDYWYSGLSILFVIISTVVNANYSLRLSDVNSIKTPVLIQILLSFFAPAVH